MRIILVGALMAALAVSACSSEDSAPAAAPTTPSSVATTTATEPPGTMSSANATPEASAATDPFEAYAKLVGPLEPTLSKDQLHEKYNTAVKMFCPGGRAQMENLKSLASNPPGASAEKTATANKKAATSLGALWEYGCGKGHDTNLYTPATPKSTAAGKSWPCEPGYPNCTKADSERYQAQLEYKRQQDASAKRDARGETREEYCKRTGQPLATCQAG